MMGEEKQKKQAAEQASSPEAAQEAAAEGAGPGAGGGTGGDGLRGEVERLSAALESKHNAHLRALADHDNYRKRVLRDRAQQAEEAKRDFLAAILPAIDALDLAIRHGAESGEPSALLEGVRAAREALESAMNGQGVTRIPGAGRFDPQLHDAQVMVPSADHDDGDIIEELRSGYRIGSLIVRHASVVVAKRAAPEAGDGGGEPSTGANAADGAPGGQL